jgi:hypothetical protein
MNTKLSRDFGVRALLATMVIFMLFIITVILLTFLYMKNILTVEMALTIISATGLPGMAMAAIAFYFGSKVSSANSNPPATNVTVNSPSGGSSGGFDLSSIITIFEDAIAKLKGASNTNPKS